MFDEVNEKKGSHFTSGQIALHSVGTTFRFERIRFVSSYILDDYNQHAAMIISANQWQQL